MAVFTFNLFTNLKTFNKLAEDHVNDTLVHTYLITYLLHGAVLLEKPIGSQLVKKFPTFYGTRRFITTFTSVRHLSVSSATSI
jgi:hypothetical protein